MSQVSTSGGVVVRFVLLVALVLVGVAVLLTFWVGPAPHLEVRPQRPGIGKRTPIAIKLDDTGRVTRVLVEVVQGMEVKPVAERTFATHPVWAFWHGRHPESFVVEVGRETVPTLRSGEATVRATAERAGSFLRRPEPAVVEVKLPVRLAPPSLAVLSSFHYVAQGGCEAVVYRVGDGTVTDGVQSGSWWFPGYPLPGGDKGRRFALFAIPFDTGDASHLKLVAADDIGNRAELSFVDKFTPRPIKTDTIQLTDSFLNRVVPEIMAQTPGLQDRGSALQNYLEINGELRRRESQELVDLTPRSAARFLWQEPFLPARNAKITAAFAQERTYVYGGQKVDHQVHLGYDMASVEHDSVTAANAGVVLLARFFGIYGNAVVIDHGYGLMSLYGHLSSLAVREGQAVRRGEELGRSGETGLAGGDHLHFTMLLRGLPVTPVEWWDPHWITDRIARKLGPASPLSAPASSPPASRPGRDAAAGPSRRRRH